MTFSLGRVAAALGLPTSPAGLEVTGWSVDSRTLEPGDLFFALRGPNHDGHAFLEAVFQRGAVAAVVEDSAAPLQSRLGPNAATTEPFLIPVPDTLEALQALAAWARSQWTGEVVAVTGSAGKTTTKEVIAALLAAEMPVGKTTGNLNNHVGLPLSLLRLPAEAQAAVLEIGMNHAGEIRRLAGIARPGVGVVTNVGYAHAEFFGSVEAVAAAKRELIEALPRQGTAVLNADDALVSRFREAHPGRTVTFGLAECADVRPEFAEYGPEGVRFRYSGTDFKSRLIGRHGLSNVLAGLAVARVFGIAPERLKDAVGALMPGQMRGERFVRAEITVLNDCYNSNPEALRAMLDVLRAAPARRRFAVLGEMLELGRWTEPLHRDVGRYVAQCGIDVLVGIRGAARYMVDEAVRSGLPAGAAVFFDDPAEGGAWLRGRPQAGDAILFKGSRGVRVERALERYLE